MGDGVRHSDVGRGSVRPPHVPPGMNQCWQGSWTFTLIIFGAAEVLFLKWLQTMWTRLQPAPHAMLFAVGTVFLFGLGRAHGLSRGPSPRTST